MSLSISSFASRSLVVIAAALAVGATAACSGSIGDMKGSGGDGGDGGASSTTGGHKHHPTASGGDDTSNGGSSASDGGSGGMNGSGGASSSTGAGAGGAAGGPSSSRLTAHPLGSTSAPQGFYEYVPPGYPASGKVPLLIALHGIGENGDETTQIDNVIHVGVGLLLSTNMWPETRPFVVLLPEHQNDGGCPSGQEIQKFIAWGMANYHIDLSRVYLTGLSCGGIGAWAYLDVALDSQIAAMVPIAGDGQGAWNDRHCDLGKVAIWAFHGDADPTVNVAGTNVPIDGLSTCASPPRKETKKTIYPGVGHDSWDQTYNLSSGNDPFAWMLTKTK